MRQNNLKILVVDDNFPMRRGNVNFLQTLGYTKIEEAKNGKEALQKINFYAEQKGDEIFFCVCDWNMSPVSGIEVLKEVRKNPLTQKIVFLMVTAEGGKENIVLAAQMGVDGYIVKPFTPPVLKERISGMAEKIVKKGNAAVAEAVKVQSESGGKDDGTAHLRVAEEFYLQAKKLCHWSIQPGYALAKLFLLQKQFCRAIEELKEASKVESTNKDLLKLLAESYAKNRDYSKAMAGYRTVTSLFPEDEEAHERMGEIALKLKMYPEALKAFNAVTAISTKKQGNDSKKLAQQKQGLGNAHRGIASQNKDDKESLAKAESALQESISLDPQLIAAHYNIMMTYKMMGNNELALKAYKKAQEVSPQTADDWSELGKVYLEQGDLKKAHFAFNNAVKNSDDKGKVMEEIGDSYLEKGMVSEAVKCFNQSKRNAPESSRVYNRLGIAHRRNGEPEKAVAEYEEALKFVTDDEAIYYNLAVAYLECKEEEKAKNSLSKAIRLAPDFTEAQNLLGTLK